MTDVQWLGERSSQGIHIAPAAGFIECAYATSTVVSLAKGPVGEWCRVILVIPGVATGTWTLSASHRIFLDFRRGGRAFDNQMGTLTCTRAGNMITLTGPGGMAYLPCVPGEAQEVIMDLFAKDVSQHPTLTLVQPEGLTRSD
ncbi:hypothetical protein KIPB_000959 [Kipferlia bialata]|uniref:Uncharacterized protein n=1 Tax=Kipferlia bialata TaxID=797122 RepID=A0A9K3CPY7_9EUKA|nr:hypothetical protein KIPB_000959 [Kipferlia bialata]|eukprot:g959.t1